MSNKNEISRLAPTPSGYLHLGNILNFYLTWKKVRESGGVLWLRVDDMDADRLRPAYVEDIFRTLEWLKIDYDKGPSGPDDFFKNFSQQKKIDYYRSKLKKIKDTFNCVCSRKIRKKKSDPCQIVKRDFTKGETVTRIKAPKTMSLGDFVIWRKEDVPAWLLTCVVDDDDMGVNLIIRGMDLQESSKAQVFLVEKLGLKQMPQANYLYHQLLVDEFGQKLSKSSNAFAKPLWEKGISARTIIDKLKKIQFALSP